MGTKLLFATLLLFAGHLLGELKAPDGWQTLPPAKDGGMILLATHQNNGLIIVNATELEDPAAASVADLLEEGRETLRKRFVITEETKPLGSQVAGVEAQSFTFRANIPDRKGNKFDMRYKVVFLVKNHRCFTIFLSCRVGSEPQYKEPFMNFLDSITPNSLGQEVHPDF